jgi:hypothetical protein
MLAGYVKLLGGELFSPLLIALHRIPAGTGLHVGQPSSIEISTASLGAGAGRQVAFG